MSTVRIQNESPSINGKENIFEDGQILKKLLDLVIKENLHKTANESQKILEFRHPCELQKELPLTVEANGCDSISEIESLLETVVKYSLHTTHPDFHNQLHGGLDEVALSGAWLLEALNTNQHTYEVSPVFTLIEKFMIQKISKLFGWEEADGIFSPGGSISNMYAINCARHKKYPHMKESGFFGQKELVIFTSDMSHYSMLKASNWLGFGTNQVVKVQTTATGRMTVEALRDAVDAVRKEGREPLFVNTTAGTTVFGAFDDINSIADLCQEKNIWMHIDACWGGTAILSEKHKYLLAGSERADSIAWNPHKMLCAPIQCSPLLIKDKKLLLECNQFGASYLFQQDKCYDVSYDLGDKSIQCGRKADAFKLWIMFKIHGMKKLENRVDVAFEEAKYLEEKIRNNDGFLLVIEHQSCTNVCFWYIPPSFRNKTRDEDWWTKLHKVAPAIKERMTKAGNLYIGYQPMETKNLVNFFRMVIVTYPVPTKQRMDFIVEEIERLGADL